MSCGPCRQTYSVKIQYFAVGNALKPVEDPKTSPENPQSLRGLVVSKYAKNQLKTKFLSKNTLFGKSVAKSPQFLGFLTSTWLGGFKIR